MKLNGKCKAVEYGSREYHRLHYSIRVKNGKATKCEFTKTCNKKSKTFDWALKKGKEYSDNIDDYYQLCRSCHTTYDQLGCIGKHYKLKEEDVLIIKELLKNKVKQVDIAKRFKVSKENINAIHKGRSWKKV